jgi:hypothetical protein
MTNGDALYCAKLFNFKTLKYSKDNQYVPTKYLIYSKKRFLMANVVGFTTLPPQLSVFFNELQLHLKSWG